MTGTSQWIPLEDGGFITRDNVAVRLYELPAEINTAEMRVIECVLELERAREQVASIEAEAILSGKVTGKNDTERKAQLATLTADARKIAAEAEAKLSMARVSYNHLINELKALRAIAQLLGQGVA